MTKFKDLPHYARKAFARLGNRRLIRTSSNTEEALSKGGGFLYSLDPGGKAFPAASAKLLIDTGFLSPANDGLLAEVSQTYVATNTPAAGG